MNAKPGKIAGLSYFQAVNAQPNEQLLDHLFRQEFAKAVAYLSNKFGPSNLEAAEDAVQDALYKAMQTWPYQGTPDNPTAWIIRVSQNRLIDVLRRNQRVDYTDQIVKEETEELDYSDDLFNDDMVRMMFACCNSKLSLEYQVILTLKILCGLSVKEIAYALLKKEETIAKSYTRGKKKFREENIALEIPSEQEISIRLETVLKAIYLLFNEGYKSSSGQQVIRKDLCLEALRLNRILLENQKTNTPMSRSLMALMCFHAARFDSRIDKEGVAISIEHQDRSIWDRALIDEGNFYLNTIGENDPVNEYFLQAAIIGIHTNSPSYSSTNWEAIKTLYDVLYKSKPGPVIGLNRIVAILKSQGWDKAMRELKAIESLYNLEHNYLYYALLGEIYSCKGDTKTAIENLNRAVEKSENEPDQKFLLKKIAALS